MNIIQQQAYDFFKFKFTETGRYEDFIQKVRSQLFEYHKAIHRLEFIDHIMTLLKQKYDNHLKVCQFPNDRNKCSKNKNYENLLFFVQNERDKLTESISPSEFSFHEKSEINESLVKIIDDLQTVKLGQQMTYDDLITEFNELKEFYFLNKRNWSQMLIGKISEMVAGGIISETISKEIVSAVAKHYEGLIK